jgi:PAS domain S-box-containing protein
MSADRNYPAWIEAIPNIVWTASPTGAFTFLNRRWTEMTGLRASQGLGFNFLQAIHPEDRDRIQAAWRRAVESEQPYEAKFRMQGVDGTFFRVIARAQLEPSSQEASQPVEWVGSFTDIESVVYCKDDLVLKQQFLEALLDNLSDGIVACDASGTLTLFNATSQVFHGLPAQPLPAERWAEYYDLYDAEGSFPMQQEDIPLFRALNGEQVRGVKMRIVPKQGKARVLLSRGAPIMHPDGHQLGAVVAMQDVTEQEEAETARKKAELEIYYLNTVLEQRVAQRTAELEAKQYQNERLLASERDARAELEAAIAQLEVINCQYEALLEREQRAKAELEAAMAQTAIYTERLTLALDAAQMGTWDWDMLTDQTIWSPRHEEIFGYQPGTPNRDYFDWEHRVHPQDVEWIHQATHAARDNHQLLALQYPITWPDGSLHWIDAKGRFFYDSSNKPIRMIGVVRDITATQQTEARLRQSEERFRRAILDAPLPVILHAEDGEVILINSVWTELSGYRSEDIPTLEDWTEKAYGAQKKLVQADIDKLYSLSARVREGEYAIRTRSGERRIWDFSSAPLGQLPDGRRLVISTALDVTDRKRNEEALRQTQEQFRATFEQAAVGIAHVDLEGHWLRVNHKLCDIVGYSVQELQQFTFQDITHPDDLEADLGYMRQLLADEIQTYAMEKRYFRKSGETVWIELTVSLVRRAVQENPDSDASTQVPQYFISVIEEINDRKHDQAELEARSRELSNFNGLLAQAAVLLEERNQELDRFVHIVSHDLKAPLRAIANLSQWIEEDMEAELSPDNQRQMRLLRERVSRMEAMINGLLDYARAGRTDAVIESVSVASLLTEVIDSLDPPQSFRIEVGSAMPTLQTKRLLLYQVFANLIGNAIKYHDRPNGIIQISSRDKGDFYEFVVADDGPGIDSVHHDKIFMIFQTVDPQNSSDSSGIGLSIVKKIVETEEGEVRVASEPGKGSTFYFTWPKHH